MRPWPLYKSLYLALALSASACRTDTPPAQELCALDGLGGGDCIEEDGTKRYRTPSQMLDFVARSPQVELAYDKWCYNTTDEQILPVMNLLYSEARNASSK